MLSFGGWVLCMHVGSDVVSNIRVLALAPALLASQYSVLCLCLCVREREWRRADRVEYFPDHV